MRAARVLFLLLALVVGLSGASVPPDPVACAHGTSDCTVSNSYGAFPDRTICRAANATFPRTEQELVAAVAAAAKRKVKVATTYSHSFPKLACPGGRDGTIISTEKLNRTVSIDKGKKLLTVESGMLLRDLIKVAGDAGQSLPHSPYFYGVTIGGLLATGAHGSSLGVISQVTLELQHLFKRSVRFVTRDDSDMAEKLAVWGGLHEFGDVSWQPWLGKTIYREDDRVVEVSTPGNGLNGNLGLRAQPTAEIIIARAEADWLQENGTDIDRCEAAWRAVVEAERLAFGFTNDGVSFTGYPVVGFQHRIQASGMCIDGEEDGLRSACPWDPRVRGDFVYESAISVAMHKGRAWSDMRRLRDLDPSAFCGMDAMGVLMRYVRASSSAHLGKPEDSLDIELIYNRSYGDDGEPRAHADVYDEIEQMALRKYGGVPHWGKNRNFAFDGAIAKYPRAAESLEVKERYDPDGIFSSEWSDQVLGISGSPSVVRPGCAIEGLCVCSEDSHCAPEQGYFCRPGKVYTEARVCRFQSGRHTGEIALL
nr:unnamed protein product [Digitaria exilis]